MRQPCYEFFFNKKTNRLKINLHDEIGFWGIQSKEFVNTLDENKDVPDIDLDINTPGGSVRDGLSIYNNLVEHPAKIHVYISGVAASMGSVIAMSGDDITMPDTAFLMIHRAMTGAFGNADELQKAIENLIILESGIVNAYKKRVNISKKRINELMAAETWFTAENAKELGFIDIIKETDEEPEDRFDFKIYNYANIPDEVMNRYDINRKPNKSIFKKLFNKNKPPKAKEGEDDMNKEEVQEMINGVKSEYDEKLNALTTKIEAQNATITTQNETILNLRETSVQNEVKNRENGFREFFNTPEMRGRVKPVDIDRHVNTMVSFYDLDAKGFTAEKKETPILDNYKETLKSFPVLFSTETIHFATNKDAANKGNDAIEEKLTAKIQEVMKRDNIAYNIAYKIAIAEDPTLNTYTSLG